MNPSPVRERTFLEDLELRQDEVLEQLADLERRVQNLLNEYVESRAAAATEA
jgi:hypothetical protein